MADPQHSTRSNGSCRITVSTPEEARFLRDAISEWASVHIDVQASGEWEERYGAVINEVQRVVDAFDA